MREHYVARFVLAAWCRNHAFANSTKSQDRTCQVTQTAQILNQLFHTCPVTPQISIEQLQSGGKHIKSLWMMTRIVDMDDRARLPWRFHAVDAALWGGLI